MKYNVPIHEKYLLSIEEASQILSYWRKTNCGKSQKNIRMRSGFSIMGNAC